MNEIVDLAAVEAAVTIRRQHMHDIRRENARQYLSRLQSDGERAIDYMRDLIRMNSDVSEEIKEMEDYGNSLVMMAALLRREASKTE